MLPVILGGALAVQIKDDLGLDDVALGVAFAVYSALAGFLAIAGGRIADRIGWRSATRTAAALSLVALLGTAWLARSFITFLVMLGLGGLSVALALPTANLILSREIPRRRQGITVGVKQSAIPVASLFAGLSVPLIALTWGWQWSYVLAAVCPIVAIGIVPARNATSSASPRMASSERPAATIPVRPLLALAVAGGTAMIAVSALRSFFVVSSVESGIAAGAAGWLLSTASIVGLTVRVASGWLADRHTSTGFRPAAVLLAVGGIGFVLLATRAPVLVAIGGLIGFGAGWGWPALYHYGLVTHNPENPASATGLVQAGAASGSALGPLAFGLAAENLGHGPAWAGAAVLIVLAAVLMLRAARRMTAAARAIAA